MNSTSAKAKAKAKTKAQTRAKISPDLSDKISAKHFDVVISGGGLSGSLMALSLADLKKTDGSKLAIAVVESSAILQDASLSFDDRVLALSHGTAAYFESLGAWQTLKKDAQAIKKIHVSDRNHYGKARLSASEQQVSALGYVVEMSLIGKSLLTALANKNNVTWFTPDQISAVKWQKEQVNLTLKSATQLTTTLLLACDGANSPCRQFAGIAASSKPYGQSALIANVSTAIPHNNVAYERFTETGPIAMLPLFLHAKDKNKGKGRCSLVWTLTPELAKKMQTLSDSDFKKQLELAFGSWLGEITHVGKRDVYPLNLLQAQDQIYHRMVLVGNASHTIHPIAGQGFNLGVRDVSQLAALIKQALLIEHADQLTHDIGALSLLNQYAEQRKKDQKQVINLTDSLVTLFSNNLPPLVVGRGVGLKVLNYVSPFKKALMNKTMGY